MLPPWIPNTKGAPDPKSNFINRKGGGPTGYRHHGQTHSDNISRVCATKKQHQTLPRPNREIQILNIFSSASSCSLHIVDLKTAQLIPFGVKTYKTRGRKARNRMRRFILCVTNPIFRFSSRNDFFFMLNHEHPKWPRLFHTQKSCGDRQNVV